MNEPVTVNQTENDWQTELLKYQKQIATDVATIRRWMVFFGIIFVIAMVVTLLGSLFG